LHSDTSDAGCELPRLASRLGEIRRTWYGDRVWDVRSVPDAKNIAYTNLDLGLHMDLLHFRDPPRFQLLHMLHAHSSLQGGESYFVDSYRAAEQLRASHPGLYTTLSTLNVGFEYRNGGHWRHAERPTLQHDSRGRLCAVNYSPPFAAPLPLHRPAQVAQLHEALTVFAEKLEAPELRHTIQLKPGN
jgi:gamma-butyrobetaine dioxygenase